MNTSAYDQLAGQLGFSGSARFRALLEHLLTPAQAEVCAALPGSPREAAGRTGLDPETVKAHLEELFFKGVVFPRGDFAKRERYRFARDIIQLHDATQASRMLDPARDKRFFALWHDFCLNEKYPFIAAFFENLPRPMARVIPAYRAVKDLPELEPWENFQEILKAQDLIAVVPCSCRFRTTAVEEHCRHTRETESWHCLQFGRGAQYILARGSGKKLTLEEALALAERIEEQGLVHIGGYDRGVFFNTSCQCCSDCCEIFVAVNQNGGDLGKIYARSRYAAGVETGDCKGCRKCLERCHFNAISLVRDGKKHKAAVDPEKCWGCGVCVIKCETGAIRLKCVQPPEYIPEKAG